jgi:hypothetical protein
MGAWSTLLVVGVALAIGCIWLGSGRIDGVMAQSGVLNPAAGQAQSNAAPPPGAQAGTAAQAQPGATSTTAAAAAVAAQSKETTIYLVGRWWSFAIAIGFLVVALILTVAVKSREGINFFQSPDGSVSVSKVQVWMWTMAIIFSYVYLFLWQGPPDTFPDSLWELMGISALSTGTAKYIAVVTGKAQQPATPVVQEKIAKQNWLASMLSDDGEPSMMRLQMFGWTLVTVFLFLMYLHKNRELWSVPQALVILMGISHAGYLADKGAAASKPN